MSKIASWLERNDLTEYTDLFAKEAIDLQTLSTLNDQDLKDLGLPLGHRRKLLDAIAKLGVNEQLREFIDKAPNPPAGHPIQAERRQLTFLFCDLINSTSLSRRLDPEDLCELISAYQQACTIPIEHYAGFIARYIGDGILAYFGYPRAHDNDAERAIRAGLAIVEAMNKFNKHNSFSTAEPLAVRIGISTGDVVAGYTVGRGAAEETAVAGEAVNLAAKLQHLAKPNTVVVSTLTKQLTAARFDFRDGGECHLGGFDKPVRYWHVLGETSIAFSNSATVPSTAFVGRKEEVAVLLRQWQSALMGRGQAALIRGKAGIGKSTLITAVSDRLFQISASAPKRLPLVLKFSCSSFHLNTAFHPIKTTILQRTGVRSNDPYERNIRKVIAFMTESGIEANSTTAGLVADLLGVQPDADPSLPTIGAREKRLRTLEMLQTWFSSLASQQPLLLIFEDTQWIDHSTGHLLGRLVTWASSASVLIMMTQRTGTSEQQNAWSTNQLTAQSSDPSHFRSFELDRLEDAEARLLVSATAAGKGMPNEVVEAILEKAEGVPLYIEELTHSLVNSSLLEDTGSQYVLRLPLSSMSIPSTLRGALMARLDQLGPAKEIAQLASIIGREFSVRLLSILAPSQREGLFLSLDALHTAGIIAASVKGEKNNYAFRHALIQETAYQSLLRRKRADMHLRLAKQLELDRATHADVTDELIAEHFARAGQTRQSIATRRRAAASAIARSAQVEAANLLEMSVAALADLPQDLDRSQLELELTIELAAALGAVLGYAAPKVESQYVKARELCLLHGNAKLRFNVEFGLVISNVVKGDFNGAEVFAQWLVKNAEVRGNGPDPDAYLAMGMVRMQQGRFAEARNLLETGARLTTPDQDEPHFFTHAQNPGILCRSYLAHALAFLGESRAAISLVESTLELARKRLGDPSHIYTYVNALAFAARVYLLLRNKNAVNQVSRELVDIAKRNQYGYFEAIGRIQQSWASATETSSHAIRRGAYGMLDGLKVLEATGTGLGLRGFYVQLAELYVHLGDKSKAVVSLNNAKGSDGWGTRVWDAEILRVRGTVLLMNPDPEPGAALTCYETALDVARRQGARTLELRAAASCARALIQLNRRSEAYDTLLGHLGDESPDAVDVADVRRLLRELVPGDNAH